VVRSGLFIIVPGSRLKRLRISISISYLKYVIFYFKKLLRISISISYLKYVISYFKKEEKTNFLYILGLIKNILGLIKFFIILSSRCRIVGDGVCC
jgi:hypothetical protein